MANFIIPILSCLLCGVVGFYIGLKIIIPCENCKLDDEETKQLLKEQQDLSNCF